MTEESQTHKPVKHRSPSYPAIDLETAVERARAVHELAGSHRAPVKAIVEAWGYSLKSSGGLLTLAALKKFGLAEDEGKRDARQLWLTTLGRELVFFGTNHDSSEWTERIRSAALIPAIHAELWSKYDGQLPGDQVIRHYLVFERGFSDSAATELLAEFRRTLAFARIDGPTEGDAAGKVSEEVPDTEAEAESETFMATPTLQDPGTQRNDPQGKATPSNGRTARTVQVPYSPTEWALVQAPFPMTEPAWNQMIAVLNAMKPGLVVAPDDSTN